MCVENVTIQGVIGEVAIQPEMIEEVLVAPSAEPLDPVAIAIPGASQNFVTSSVVSYYFLVDYHG